MSAENTCSHGGIYSVNPKLVKVDFSSSINPLGISQIVLNSICKRMACLSSMYPDPQCMELKKSLVDYLGIELDLDWITIGNGATEIIHHFASAFVHNRVVIPSPTFCEYETASKRMDSEVTFVPLKNFRLDVDSVIENSKDSDAIFLCNPNNPTGLLCSKISITKILERIRYPTIVLIDESFIELVDTGGGRHSIVNKIKEFDNLIIIRSLTKSFGLAGLRVGYSICAPKLAKKISAYQIPWHVNGIAQDAGIAALKDLSHLSKARRIIKKERKFIQSSIIRGSRKWFMPLASNANYFLVHVKNITSTKLRDTLLIRNGILVRDCSTFTGMEAAEYIRVCVKTHDENLLLLNALESIDI